MKLRRRGLLVGTAGAVASLAGCSGGQRTAPDADVLAGPGGRLVFEPAELTVSSGSTVTWLFETAGHNVSARPDHSDLVELPAGAAPFASYGPEGLPRQLVPAGQTYCHAFTTPGVYQYVCIPHQGAGMAGRVQVE